MKTVKDNCTDAAVICHSVNPNGDELITVEVNFHRFILAEVNTHRVLSRNYQSSRAVPVEKMIEQVRNSPAMPVHWGKNQRGMVAENEQNTNINVNTTEYMGNMSPVEAWRAFARQSADQAESMNEAGYHKQIVNRLIEPFIWTKGVITATREDWESVFKLRCHKDAQPEFQVLANKIRETITESIPDKLEWGKYHLPYVDKSKIGVELTLEQAIKISCSCCAQVSYRVLDDSLDKAERIYDLLNLPENGEYKEDPPHFSPAEHVALADEFPDYEDSGNFKCGWWQYRKALEYGSEEEFMGYYL